LKLEAVNDGVILRLMGVRLRTNPETGDVLWKQFGKRWELHQSNTAARGYKRVMFRDGNRRRALAHHRIVWISVHGVPEDPSLTINHINGDRTDNRIANLELIGRAENVRLGRHVQTTKEQVSKIRSLAESGLSYTDISRALDIHRSRVRKIAMGRSWAHLPGATQGPRYMTPGVVLKIRELCAQGGMTYSEMGRMFEVDPKTIQRIAHGKTWKHVGGPRTKRPSRRPDGRMGPKRD